MTDRHLRVHIGEGSTLDGGPYFACEVVEALKDGTLLIRDQEGNTRGANTKDMTLHLADEVRSGEPIHVTGVPRDEAVGYVTIPIADWMLIDVPNCGRCVWPADEIDASQIDIEIQPLADKHGVHVGSN